jgi:hypothetical protein
MRRAHTLVAALTSLVLAAGTAVPAQAATAQERLVDAVPTPVHAAKSAIALR